ncbi:hypothetical protein [Pseudohalocynthiibacter sp. F2068]|nr:hypothetical protein [Pseudohalocynthiibacter sp. F2068]MCK0102531.1 hypothetical protein [Pseudohalocynthiibacter sp. F2068]
MSVRTDILFILIESDLMRPGVRCGKLAHYFEGLIAGFVIRQDNFQTYKI